MNDASGPYRREVWVRERALWTFAALFSVDLHVDPVVDADNSPPAAIMIEPAEMPERGERGTVYVRFAIDVSGQVQSSSLARSSGFGELDQEVLSLVRRASPFPRHLLAQIAQSPLPSGSVWNK